MIQFPIMKLIYIVGYNMVRNMIEIDLGVAWSYIRDTISFSERKDLVPESLEMICIEVRRPQKVAFLISAWYWPPNSKNDACSEFDLFLRKCDLENKELMIVGDISCDFAKAVPDSHTRRLQLSCSLHQLDQLIIEPTRVTGGSARKYIKFWCYPS